MQTVLGLSMTSTSFGWVLLDGQGGDELLAGYRAAKPLVPGAGIYPEPPAQLPPVRAFLARTPHKLAPPLQGKHR